MINMIIVDDESLVCVGLRSMLVWSELGIEIVGTARNGQQAIEMIDELRPDIVITDIRMPLKSGIELLEECEDKYGRNTLFIMLTSYEDFDYARRAVKAQAVDYLIKLELTPEILCSSVNKALNILKQQKKLLGIPNGSFSNKQLRDRFFARLYCDSFDSGQQFQAMRDEAKIQFNAYAYAASIFSLTLFDHGSQLSEDGMVTCLNVMNMVEETLNRTIPCYISTLEPNVHAVTFCFLERNPIRHKELMESTLGKTISMIENYFNVTLHIAVGHVVADPLELSESYQSAKSLVSKLSQSASLLFMEKHRYTHYLIHLIQSYIQEHLQNKISQNDVAVEFHLSSGYLSHLFSRYADMGFIEYVNFVRVNAAKELLMQGDKRINEISNLVGFENAFYFSNVFKKMEGIAPREWRNQFLLKSYTANEQQKEFGD